MNDAITYSEETEIYLVERAAATFVELWQTLGFSSIGEFEAWQAAGGQVWADDFDLNIADNFCVHPDDEARAADRQLVRNWRDLDADQIASLEHTANGGF